MNSNLPAWYGFNWSGNVSHVHIRSIFFQAQMSVCCQYAVYVHICLKHTATCRCPSGRDTRQPETPIRLLMNNMHFKGEIKKWIFGNSLCESYLWIAKGEKEDLLICCHLCRPKWKPKMQLDFSQVLERVFLALWLFQILVLMPNMSVTLAEECWKARADVWPI